MLQHVKVHSLPPAAEFFHRHTALLWQAAAAGAGALLSAGRVYGGAAPFGLAFVMACPPGALWSAAGGAALGTLLGQPSLLGVLLLGALAAVMIARLVAARLGAEALLPAVAAGSGVLAAEQLILMLCGAVLTPAQSLTTLATALLAAPLAWALHRWPPRKPAGCCLWLALATVCAQRGAVGLLAPGLILAAAGGLTTACAGSLEQTAVLALALAAALTAASPALCCAALAVAAGALAASVACAGQRWACAGVFAACCALGALAAPDLSAVATLAAGAGAGVALYSALPAAWLRGMFPPPAPPAETQSLSAAARRLSAVADTLSDIAATVNAVCARQSPPRGESYDYVVDYAARQVCSHCSQRNQCWVQGYVNAMDGLYQLRPVLEAKNRLEVEDLCAPLSGCIHPVDLCTALTHGYRLWCARRQTRARTGMLRSALTEQYAAMAAALAQLADRLGRAGLPDARRQAKVVQLFAALGLEPLECSVTADVAGRVTVNVTVPRTSFTPQEGAALAEELGHLCRRDFAPPECTACRTVTMLCFEERPLFSVSFGAAGAPAPGQTVSGDAHDAFCDHAGRAQLLLCDGMGTGKAAAVDGQLAARLTAQLLRAGFAAESAARLVNVAMSLKNTEQESGATLDLLTVDLFTGRAGLFKAGAAPSFVVRGGEPRTIEGTSLPMGILESVVGRSTALSLNAGDLVLLVSDGALCDGPGWILQQLQLCARLGHTAQQTAQVVADSAIQRAGAKRDDITVVALRLERVG